MKIMKSNIVNYVCGLFMLGAVTTTQAQSTWNYFISDAGAGNSLVTWSVSGDLATPPGALRVTSASSLAVSVSAPGIYTDSYAASGADIPTPDGSYFQYYDISVYAPIVSYDAYNAPTGGNDRFGLLTTPQPRGGLGMMFLYHPGTQSALIPIDFSDINPGTYQSQQSGFGTLLTVNLTIGPVPEPSTLAFFALGGLSGLLLFCRRK